MTGIGAISPSMAQIITDAITQALLDTHTGMPAKVLRFDDGAQACDVQPLIQRTFLDEDGVEQTGDLPSITNVPVMYPAGGGWVITWPLAEGDVVWLCFAERSMDKWLNAVSGTCVDPKDSRLHDLSDAVAFAGLRPRSAAIQGIGTSDLRIAREDGANGITLKPDGTIELGEGAPTRGVARVNDPVEVTIPMGAVLVAAPAPPGFQPNPAPITVTGQITGASDMVKAK